MVRLLGKGTPPFQHRHVGITFVHIFTPLINKVINCYVLLHPCRLELESILC